MSTTLGLGWPPLDFFKMILALEIGGIYVELLSSPKASCLQLLIAFLLDKYR